MMIGAERLEPPGPYEEVATEPDVERAAWLALLLALAGPGDPERQAAVLAAAPALGAVPDALAAARAHDLRLRDLGGARRLAGGGPDRRARLVAAAPLRPRLSSASPCPASRARRASSCSSTLGASGRFALVPDQLELGAEGDPATTAAKRILQSGDRMLLERRARDLAAACEVPLAALDRALALWGDPEAEIDAAEELPAAMRSALALR